MKKASLLLFLAACFLWTACNTNSPAATELPASSVVSVTDMPTIIPTETVAPPTETPTPLPASPTAVPASPAPSPTAEPTAPPETSFGELARGYVSALSEGIGMRTAGSLAEETASEYIFSMFESFGYLPEVQEFTESMRSGGEVSSSNIIAVKEGLSEEVIIVGAHYDSVSVGTGADDNASGVAVMLEAAQLLKGVATPYTIYFIAFGAEEEGLVGSTYYANQMTEDQQANTLVMVNLDSLVAGDNAYVYGDGDEGSEIREWLILGQKMKNCLCKHKLAKILSIQRGQLVIGPITHRSKKQVSRTSTLNQRIGC